MKNKLFKSTLLLSLLSFSVSLANTYEDNTFLDNTRISVDFGFGLPQLWLSPEKTTKELKLNGTPLSLKAKPNFTVGVLANYNFFNNDKVSIGPEIGLIYGFARKFQFKNYEISIDENYLQIPLYLRITFPSSEESFIGKHYILGYDANIILSSNYKQSGIYADLASDFHGNKNLKETIQNFSKFSGSFVIGGGLEFPKGIYLSAKFKIANEVFKYLSEKDKKIEQKLDMKFLNLVRVLSATSLEFNLGIDIMKLIE